MPKHDSNEGGRDYGQADVVNLEKYEGCPYSCLPLRRIRFLLRRLGILHFGGSLEEACHWYAPPSSSDLATIFFGASSLALIIFSLLLAAAAIIEWQSLKADVKNVTDAAEKSLERVRNLEEKVRGRLNSLEQEIRGRVDSVMGLMFGTLHSDPLKLEQQEEKKDYIAEAVYFCQNGYNKLKDLEGYGKYMALNNLVFFSCLLGREAKRDLYLEQARELRDVGRKFDAAAYLLTYCRAALTYATEPAALKEALATAEELTLEAKPTNLQKLEAAFYAASLRAKIRKLTGQSSLPLP